MKFSDRVEAMQFSPIRKFNPIAIREEKKGKTVYHLNIGQPDVPTPPAFMKAIRDFDVPVIKYQESGGDVDLKDAVIDYFSHYGISYEPKDIMVTNGGSEALTMAFQCLVNPGEEVLIPEPFYTNYNTFLQLADGKVVPITTTAEEGFCYASREKIEPLITEKTRAICCISPGNPTGNVLSMEDMKTICQIAKEHDLFVMADEVYREFVYDGKKPVSFGMLSEYQDRIIIIDSVSKRHSACGARIGLLISKNEELMSNVMKIAQGRLCVSTVDQVGAAALFRLPFSYYDEVREEYRKRRDVVYDNISKIPGVVCQKPGGAFYMTVKLPVESAEDFLMFMLTEFEQNGETAMFSPAGGFYATPGQGENEVRLAYVLNQEKMKRGSELIRLGLEAYKKKLGK